MVNNLNFRKIIITDFRRIYACQPQEFPKNKIYLLSILFIYFLGSKGFRSIFFYRLINTKFKNRTVLKIPLLILRRLLFCLEIPYTTEIGEGLLLGHADGILINGKCTIGKNCTIHQGVTIGGSIGKIKDGIEAPIIGNDVYIGAGAKILGPITIGNNCMIGANAVVVKDIPHNSVAVGVPAKVIKENKRPYIEIENEFKLYMMKNND
jgi:serine O-acetyltransferase